MATALTLGSFITHMRGVASRIGDAEARGVEAGAITIRDEAKRVIGREQADWRDLAPRTVAAKRARGHVGRLSATDPLLATGQLRSSIQYLAQGRRAMIGSDDPVAVYQEFGTGRIPARSFLGASAYRKHKAVARLIGRAVAETVAGR